MDWESRFADRTRGIQQSTVREFLKHATRPGVISFAGGLPDPDLLPVDETRLAVDAALARHGSRALQYGVTEGVLELREQIAERYRDVGATAENVLITTGSQQALDLIGRVLLNHGARVAVQNPTYLAALSAWRAYGADFIPGRNGSPLPEEPAPQPDLLYCIPNFLNPTGESLDPQERAATVAYALEHRVPLVEDDPYGELRYGESPHPRSLLSIAGNVESPVIHVGTISKVLAPGFRIGWIVGAKALMGKLAVAKQSLDLHTSTFCQYVVVELLAKRVLEGALPRLRLGYSEKRHALLQALTRHMPPRVTWTRPAGGFFLLLRLQPEMDGSRIASRALAADVLVVPGEEFHVRAGRDTLRLCFASTRLEQIDEGISRLTAVLASNAW